MRPGILRSDLEGVVRVYQPDAIVTSGGVSHGKFEVVPASGAEAPSTTSAPESAAA